MNVPTASMRNNIARLIIAFEVLSALEISDPLRFYYEKTSRKIEGE